MGELEPTKFESSEEKVTVGIFGLPKPEPNLFFGPDSVLCPGTINDQQCLHSGLTNFFVDSRILDQFFYKSLNH